METFVVRVWLPDLPGALAQVAGRIGAVGGDVVGIEILERGGGSAIDELTVSLPEPGLVELLINEIRQVEGVAVEDVRPVAADRPEGAMAVLQAVERIVSAPAAQRWSESCDALRSLVDGDWAVVVHLPDGDAIGVCGTPPDIEWLTAFLNGSEHLGSERLGSERLGSGNDHTPGDLAWTRLSRHSLALATGRSGRV
ncbi:MAG: hypothetical protein WCI22_18865, partial [Actinomycetota bacterium]